MQVYYFSWPNYLHVRMRSHLSISIDLLVLNTVT